MIVPSSGVKVLIAMKPVDFRKGMDGLAAVVHETLGANPFGSMCFDPSGPELWGEVQPPASLKRFDIPSRRAVFVPWKPSRRRGFGMGNPTFR